jgi:hypothetical protein
MKAMIDDYRVTMPDEVFTTELILAICWEETFFTNLKQSSGTAVGFAQVEPSEFSKLETAEAGAKGYRVTGLPPRRTKDVNGTEVVFLDGTLTDQQSIQVTSALLYHYYFAKNQNQEAALEAYAGVGFSRQIEKDVRDKNITPEKAHKIDPLGVAGRQKKIRGWRECERILLYEVPNMGDVRPKIRDALNASRTFPMNDATWNDKLFQVEDHLPTSVQSLRCFR